MEMMRRHTRINDLMVDLSGFYNVEKKVAFLVLRVI